MRGLPGTARDPTELKMNSLRYAFRQLRKLPAFTLTALAAVALCRGANLAIVALINSVPLRPLPFPQSDRLISIFNTYPRAGVECDGSSLTNYYLHRMREIGVHLALGAMPAQIRGMMLRLACQPHAHFTHRMIA